MMTLQKNSITAAPAVLPIFFFQIVCGDPLDFSFSCYLARVVFSSLPRSGVCGDLLHHGGVWGPVTEGPHQVLVL